MAFNFKQHHNNLLFVPLGGSNEIGMNLNLYHLNGKWLMVDLGIGFADPYLPGVDIVVPNIDFIIEHKDDLLGLILTHAHEDHLGAVPYLWSELKCPIYATPFTSAFLKLKLADEGIAKHVKITEMNPGDVVKLDPFTIEMVPLTHSIPEMQAIAIRTSEGVVMHTGDWKFDHDPMVGPVSDYETLKKYGDEGVLAIVCDSTNVFVEGESGSESDVRQGLVDLIATCKERVILTTFASNVARLESIIHAAHEAGRKVALAGRSLWRILDAAQDSGYMKVDYDLLTDKQAMELPRDEVVIICTGCQGEPRAALTKISRGEHPNVRIAPGDAVIFAARKIPGNETRINWLQNSLVQKGIEVITDREHFIHVSGHPARDELSRMYQLIRPQIAVPVHGEPMHIHEHVKLAKALQVPETVEAHNGAVIHLKQGEARTIGTVESGYLAIDGNTMISTDSPVIRMRRRIRDDGIIVASIVLDKDNEPVARPKISAPGALDNNEDAELIQAIEEELLEGLEGLKPRETSTKINDVVRSIIRRITRNELGKKPVIEVQIIRV